MSFHVVPDPQVSLAISSLSGNLQDFYKTQILPPLARNPYPSPDNPLIEIRTAKDGSPYYQYYDGIVPLVIQYFIRPLPDDPDAGVVFLFRALPKDGATKL